MNMMPGDLPTLCKSGVRSRALVEAALCPQILLGMPHLTPFGLSRTWLLKELGHRHWLLLAGRLGLDDADFRTPDGNEAYAAFSALKIDARLSRGRPNAVLTIRSNLYRVSDTRTESLHALQIDGHDIGTVVLQSVFVARTGQDNRSIRRSLVRHFRTEGPVAESLLTEDIAALRLCNEPDGLPEREMSFQPCPFEEFNGAGLLYFAEYVGLMGRAFCQWEGQAAAQRLDRPLAVLFSGNINQGEKLRIGLYSTCDQKQASRCVIQRPDGSVLVRALFG
ncbi:DNA gyrase [Rhizobium sp. CG5]|uniref:Pnap_2097 family protein n=1 Tax=Rhizobium sp. CG5 TaxID=2726076 RepID=UPI002033E770|nr:Pnap_2097 family protein [Rhizobium sp. CG5]MCM2474491.1 DNA gyrase [Rhizobium sp. CG5]